MTRAIVPVLAAPLIDPGTGRIDLELPEGLTVLEMVRTALPDATTLQLARCRVALVTPKGEMIIEQGHWGVVRPRAGVNVVIRLVPGKNALRSVLQIVVSIAAVALGQLWAPALAGAFGISNSLAAAAIGLGVTAIGNLLINALIPPQGQNNDAARPTFLISGWQNQANPDGPVPVILGRHRVAPVFAAPSYTEIVGDLQYVRALFCFGYGPLTLTDFKIGETSIDEYDEVEMEVREGLAADEPVSLYPRQVLEDQHGTELQRQAPRDDFGEPTGGPIVDQPVTRFTAADSAEAAVIIGFPAGLLRINDDGEERVHVVSIRIRQRPAGSDDPFEDVITLDIRAQKREAFYRTHRWSFPERGRYEIELTRLTNEANSTQISERCVWYSLQSIRPEYPLAFDKPLALVAVRVKATYQLNNALDNFNAVAALRCLDFDAATDTWIERETRNPASLYRYVLQGPANAYPAPDAEVDIAELEDWHTFCVEKGLKYGRIHQESLSLAETLAMVAAAGRASPRHDGRRWGVVVDRPRSLVIDHINPRNSRDFRWSRQYLKLPDALRVSFLDETNDYQSGERIVPWPGHVGEILVTEQLDMPGKTDPAEIWRETRRRQYEIMHRPDSYTAIQDGAARVATRGDLVMGSFDVLSHVQRAARVVSVRDDLVELDDFVVMEAAEAYAIRFRIFADSEDTIGESVVRQVRTVAGERSTVGLTGTGSKPPAGTLIHFGPVETESMPLIVAGVEPGEEFTGVLTMIDASPIIDELTDAEIAPDWDGRVGEILIPSGLQPAQPRFVRIATGIAGTDVAGGLVARLEPGSGGPAVGSYELGHRLTGAPTFTPIVQPVAAGGFEIGIYDTGDQVDLRARAISVDGVAGPYTATATIEIGADDAPLPMAIPGQSITAIAGTASVEIAFSTGDDAALSAVRLRRDGVVVGSPVAAAALGSFSLVDGDATRVNLVGPLVTSASWSAGTGWSIAAGKATHGGGSAGDLSHPVTLANGATHRLAFTISGRTAGTVTPKFTGGTPVNGAAQSGNGRFSVDLVAASNTALAFTASGPFDGSIENIKIYRRTPASLAAGTFSYQLEPLNADGAAGPLSSPLPVTI